MSANLTSYKCLRVEDAANATGTTTISVADFAPQGCTIRAIVMETQASAGGAGTIAITKGSGGNSLFNLGAPANQDQSARTTGVTTFQLTTTDADLKLAATDSIVIVRATANSQSDYSFYYGDFEPKAVTTVLS